MRVVPKLSKEAGRRTRRWSCHPGSLEAAAYGVPSIGDLNVDVHDETDRTVCRCLDRFGHCRQNRFSVLQISDEQMLLPSVCVNAVTEQQRIDDADIVFALDEQNWKIAAGAHHRGSMSDLT